MSSPLQSHENRQFIQFLPEVKAYIAELEHQDLWWSTVGMVGKINNENIDSQLLESIVETQKEFQNLRDIMINELISRYRNQANSEIILKTQTAIDIVIRNLFERTADVGFLAVDDDLIDYLTVENRCKEQAEFIQNRIKEYVAKYSVYSDIALVKPNGDICATLNPQNTIKHSDDPIIQEALNSNADYLEVYRHSDLFAYQETSLIYAKKMCHINDKGESTDVGVLCLSFNFNDEMVSVFHSLNNGSNHEIMLLGENESVIASSNHQKKPIDKKIVPALSSTPEKRNDTLKFSTKTNGYQGFTGLPWLGHVEIDIQTALTTQANNELNVQIEKSSPLYQHELEQVNIRVSTLLLTVILNGKIMSLKRDVKSFLPILDNFQIISLEIQEIFARFIDHIHQVLVNTILAKIAFSAALSIEIMDRNLYERANDCRWWALNSTFRKILSDHHHGNDISSEQTMILNKKLNYINDLYTVYTNIILYDAYGKILAVSNKSEREIIGSFMPNREDVMHCLKKQDTQEYSVSRFEKSILYNDKHTYIYHAPIKSWNDMTQNVGGIALVFDSEPEFIAMLNDTEPKYSLATIENATFSAFIDRSGKVISSTKNKLTTGQKIEIPQEVLQAENGTNTCFTFNFEGQRYLVGYKVSQGYREYKNSDGYTNDVISLVFTGI